jgi:thioredoxin-related protein
MFEWEIQDFLEISFSSLADETFENENAGNIDIQNPKRSTNEIQKKLFLRIMSQSSILCPLTISIYANQMLRSIYELHYLKICE